MPPVADILVPLFAAIALGAACGAARLFDLDQARVLSRFVFLVAMPVAVLDFMRATDPPGPAYAGLIGGYLLAMLSVAALTLFVCRRLLGLGTNDAGAAVFATVCGNAVFLGLPIALAVGAWAPPFLILMLCEGVFVFAIGAALMTWPAPGAPRPPGGALGLGARAGLKAGRNPIVLATLAGLVLAVTGLVFPSPVSGFLDHFGAIAGPAGLFVLGLYLALLPRGGTRAFARPLALLLPIKLVLFPALAGSLVWLLTRDGTFTATAILFTGLPPAVASVVQAAHYRAWETGTAALVGSGTLLGLVSVSLGLLVLIPG